MASERLNRHIDRLLNEAEEAISQLDWATVRARSQAVLTYDPDNVDALAFLAGAQRALGGEGPVQDAKISQPPSSAHTPPKAEPTSFANGRYQIKELIGEGGKKRVYQAHDSVLDRDVALAAIKTEGLDPTSRVRINREAQAMGRLGDHPHVLQIFDLGDEAGQPYMVLPLMPGGDVETLLEKAEDHRLPLEQAVDLAVQVCRGLEFAHSKGIVHRDLKPGNIWLSSDGTARIGDFGLAVAIDRSRLTQEGMMVGTVSYMPPEQAMGGDVTPQSDLYSLGAMLYEMVCGRPPFLGDDSVAIIGQHINTPPVAPTWHNSECPRALEALILRLLTKDPSARPESAADVLTALEGVDLAAPLQTLDSDETEVNVLDSLAGGVFVGRHAEMGELKAALEDALSGRGRMVTVVGEPGIGKTRISEELATYARMRGARVLWGRSYEDRGMPPYWPWVQFIRRYVRDADPENLRSEMGSGAADIAEMVSDVRDRFPDLPAPPVMEPEQARFKLFDSITAFLRSASRTQPMMLVLDDLHWSDKPTLLLLEFLARELSGARLLLVGTYRDMELNRRHPLAQTLGELTRERLFQRVLLRGLSRDDIGRFIEVTSGIIPPTGLLGAVHTQTEGNPLFVTEVVRLLVQEGELNQDPSTGSGRASGTESWNVRIPEGVREVIGRRLDRLTERCNETLTIASVIGRDFGLDQLDMLIEDISQDRLLDVLDEALSARVIEELPDSVGRYQFTHLLIQETLSEELSLTRRTRLHARIAEGLEELYGAEAEAYAAELAHHFAQAEAVLGTEKLMQYSIVAGERAIGSKAYEEALVHFQRALTAMEDSVSSTNMGQNADAKTATILFGLGRAQVATVAVAQAQEAVDTLRRAFDAFVGLGDTKNAVAAATHPHVFLALTFGSADVAARALDLVASDSLDAGYLLARHGGAATWETEDDYESAQQSVDMALEIARRERDRNLEVRALAYNAQIRWVQGHHREAVEKFLPVIELAQSLDELDTLLRAEVICTHALLTIGDGTDAQKHAKVGLEAAERFHNRSWLVQMLRYNATLAILTGEWKVGEELNARALVESPADAYAVANSVLLNLQVGNLEESSEYVKQALELVPDVVLGVGDEHAHAAAAIPLFARVTGTTELLDVAESTAKELLSSPSARSLIADAARIGLGLVAIERSDAESAKEQYSFLESRRGTQLDVVMCGDRLLGLLAQTIGNLDDAEVHFDEALAFCRKAGYRTELAWSLCDYADLLLARDAEGDHRKATTLLDESLAISSELGMRPLMERVLSRKMSLQGIDISSPQTSIDAVVSAVEVERPNLQPHAAPDGTVTVMFTDIEGSTAMTERLGDSRAHEVLGVHNAIVREHVAAHQGFEVKNQGDGFMLAFSSARRALECAIAIQQTLGAHNTENPSEPVQVRIGLHTGEAIKEGEDFFGKSVILAARIASHALGAQILVSSLLKALVESRGEFEFGDERNLELKGLSGSYSVYEVAWR